MAEAQDVKFGRLGLLLALINSCSGARRNAEPQAATAATPAPASDAATAGPTAREADAGAAPSEPTRPTPCGPLPASRACLEAGVAQFGRTGPEARFDEQPARAARLRAFALDLEEVTAADYAAFASSSGAAQAPCDDGAARPESGAARCVSWAEARDFCARRGGRLPTEAEWERAAAGVLPQHRAFPWGDDPSPAGDGGRAGADITPEGIHAMGGGVAEWVDDAGAFYLLPPRPDAGSSDGSAGDAATPSAPRATAADTAEREGPDAGSPEALDAGLPIVDDPRGPHEGPWRIVRGGDDEAPITDWTTSRRRFRRPTDRRHWIGFRCAYDAVAP